MNDIQKAIDILEYNSDKGEYSVSGKELKSLLEQVAKEQKLIDRDEVIDPTMPRGTQSVGVWKPPTQKEITDRINNARLVTDNLTFNED